MKTVDLPLEIIQMTDEALLLSDGEFRRWVPIKLIKNYDADWGLGPQPVEIEVPEWLASEVGWI